jgi:hypothetical protein
MLTIPAWVSLPTWCSGRRMSAVWRAWETPQWVKTDPPAVDFEAEMVLVAALGTWSSMSAIVAIDSVTERQVSWWCTSTPVGSASAASPAR